MSYGLNLGWRSPIRDYIGFLGGPLKGYTTNLVQGSYESELVEDKQASYSSCGRII